MEKYPAPVPLALPSDKNKEAIKNPERLENNKNKEQALDVSSNQEIEEYISYIWTNLCMIDGYSKDLTRDINWVNNMIEELNQIRKTKSEILDKETSEFLLQLEAYLKYLVFLGNKNPRFKDILGISRKRDSFSEFSEYVINFVREYKKAN